MSDPIPGGPWLVACGLLADEYADSAPTTTNYLHPNGGTSEGQFIFIRGAYQAYEALQAGAYDVSAFGLDGNDIDTATDTYLRSAQMMCDAIGDGSINGPILRQPVPTSDDTITLMHWTDRKSVV